VVERLPSKRKALGSVPSSEKKKKKISRAWRCSDGLANSKMRTQSSRGEQASQTLQQDLSHDDRNSARWTFIAFVVREIICNLVKNKGGSWVRWCMPLIPAFGRQKQVDLCEFKASLVYHMEFQAR